MLQLVIEKPATLSRKHHHPPGNSLITHGVGKITKKSHSTSTYAMLIF